MKIWYLSLLILFTQSLQCFAQKSYRLENITVEDGLSQSSITSMAQDESGYLWIGTQDGLNRYDGYTFKIYRNKESDSSSLQKNYVTKIFIDSDQMIWVATLGYLSRYNPASDGFTNYPLTIEGQSANQNTYVREIFRSRNGKLILSTSIGIIAFNTITGKYSREKSIPDFDSDAIGYYETATKGDWALYQNLVFHRLSGTQEWIRSAMRSGRSYFDPNREEVYLTLLSHSNNNPYHRLFKYDTAGNWTQPVKQQTIHTQEICFSSNGNIWIASDNGVSVYDEKNKLLAFISPREISTSALNQMTAIYETRDGVIWLGTNGYGLKKYNPQTNQFGYIGSATTSSFRLSHNYVDAVYTDNDTIVYVTTPAGLDILNLYEKTAVHINHNERLKKISKDSNGQLWFSNDEELWRLSGHRFISSGFSTNTSINPYPSDPMAFIGHSRIAILDHGKKQLLLDKPLVPLISNLQIIGDSLWIGLGPASSQIKLFRLSSKKLLVDFIHDPKNPNTFSSEGSIKCVLKDSRKNIWIGSNSGLSLYNSHDKKFSHFSEKDGLPNNTVYGILEDDQHKLWLSTNKGLCEFNPQTKQVRNFEAFDGLQSNEFNTGAYFKSRSGTMYFGGVNGVTYFHPDDIATRNPLPHSVISGYYINNNLLINYTDQVSVSNNESVFKLKAGEHDFGFDFVGVGFSLPGRTKYRYTLENYDKEWHDIGNIQHINFTNIPPGNYVFRVKSSDPNGNWETTGASVVISIDAPFWKKPDVWVLSLTLFAATLVVIYYGRIRSLKRNAARLAGMVNERTLEIRKQNIEIASQNQELLSQAAILEGKNNELEKAKGLLEIEVKYLHQRQLLKSSIDVQEDERKRIAQDLHDELGAVLSIARMHLVQIQQQEGEGIDRKAALQQAQTLTESALATMRRISHELMPPQLEEFGLIKTLRAIAMQTNAARQIKLELIADDDLPRWALAIELGLYRICMEMINNTLKHAEAKNIYIQLNQLGDEVVCSYSDDGKGLAENYIEGHGFKNIEARLNSIGGIITIGNQSTGGFYALLRIPLRKGIQIM